MMNLYWMQQQQQSQPQEYKRPVRSRQTKSFHRFNQDERKVTIAIIVYFDRK